MALEQTNFFDVLDGGNFRKKSSDQPNEHPKKPEEPTNLLKPEDGLGFDCEICQDAMGGCPSCGFGRNRNKNRKGKN